MPDATTPTTEPRIGRAMVAGQELFICDNMIDAQMVQHIGAIARTLNYLRTERSRADTPVTAGSADISAQALAGEPFFARLREIAAQMFPGEQLKDQRAYVNSSTYGDDYYIHRDTPVNTKHVTLLYYANLHWEAEWGGETIFYDENYDAQVVVSPKPGRLVVSRSAILHRGTVPTRSCYEQRLTLAYKMWSE